MKRLMRLSGFCVALAMAAGSIAEAQQPGQGRDGAGQQRGQQGQGQGRQRGGNQGGRGGQTGGFRGGASGGIPGAFGGLDKLTLIAAKPIQEELKLSEDELFLINKLVDDHRTEARALFTGIDFRSLSEEDRRTKFEEVNKKRVELSKTSEKGLTEFLSAEQSKRLDEISVQLLGIRALTNDVVAKKLDITAEQKKGVEEALASADADRRKMFEEVRAAGGGFEGVREKMEEARKKSDEKALAVLSADQKTKFEALKGKPFEVDRRALFSFGGRGGQPGQPGQGQGGRPGQRPQGDGQGTANRPRRPATEE